MEIQDLLLINLIILYYDPFMPCALYLYFVVHNGCRKQFQSVEANQAATPTILGGV